ncbi:DUF4846 domain-containing protein [Sinanaerobacter chloroacetimidivorans]|uniref:DUF4846 domain-containing protein n=1 Tax=Sinanaerobacter chloroacetimidivorans TaxID=2818044 RepID=A0A8J8B0D8_9FIRM|nr:DUF4846 domain-containing protein [Sinanaerobacter chloroacetimidivorans]MBR0596516.1 DUF4846 domain-containing protein [Sinanaerobacter chloroacetimidivorans]
MKKIIVSLLSLFLICSLLLSCSDNTIPPEREPIVDVTANYEINKEGDTVESRFLPPKGYERLPAPADTVTAFLRELKLKPDGSRVLLYDGSEKGNQSAQAAVLDMDIGSRDLQQCADAIIRLRAEYFYAKGDYESIGFHLTNGFYLPYGKWKDGYRLVVQGNETYLKESAGADESYENLRRYLDMVFAYAGTLSVEKETFPVDNINDIKPGDLFIEGGSPGHGVMVIDIVGNQEGDIAFLLAQSYMPAQEIHVLKNPLHEEDPWYYVSELTYPFKTPQWTFEEGSLRTYPN